MTAAKTRKAKRDTPRPKTGPPNRGDRTKRPKRPRGRERPYTNSFDIVYAEACGEALYLLGSVYEHLGDGRHVTRHGEIVTKARGPKPAFPPEAFIIFEQYIGHAKCSEREAEAALRHAHRWEPIRAELAKRFPDYSGLAPGSTGPTRSQYHRWKKQAIRPGAVEAVLEQFSEASVALAKAMGCYDESHRGFTNPHLSDQIIGDGTVAKSMFNTVVGEEQWNPATEEWELVRADPDARHQHRKDDNGEIQRSDVAGTHYGMLHAATGHLNETIVLDVSHVEGGPGNNEANQMVDRLAVLVQIIGEGAKGVPYDMAMRGKQLDRIYDLGLLPHVKVAAGPDGNIKQTLIEAAAAVYQHGEKQPVGTIVLVAADGQFHVRIDNGIDIHLVPITHEKITRHANPGGRSRPYRWLLECELPDDPRLDPKLRGGLVRVRLDTTDSDAARKLNRAENVRAIHRVDPRWKIVGGQRSRAEALFSRVKHRWANGRLNAVGKDRQLLRLLGIALAVNREAAIAYERRTGHPPGG